MKPVPYEEAAELIAQKPVVTREIFDALLPDLKGRAFLISGVEDMNVVQEIRDVIAELPRGASWESLKGQIVEKLGPWMDEETAKKRANLLLRHHGFQAYAAAKHRELMEVTKTHPFWKYLSMGDELVRDSHAALHGLILRHEHPFWADHFPPWDWGCRCMVAATSEAEELRVREAGRVAGQFNPTYEERVKGWVMDPDADKALQGGNLDQGGGMPIDVRSPVQRVQDPDKQDLAYRFNPGDMTIPLAQLQKRYDALTFAVFESSAKSQVLPDGRSVWDWLSLMPVATIAAGAALTKKLTGIADSIAKADRAEVLKLAGQARDTQQKPNPYLAALSRQLGQELSQKEAGRLVEIMKDRG